MLVANPMKTGENSLGNRTYSIFASNVGQKASYKSYFFIITVRDNDLIVSYRMYAESLSNNTTLCFPKSETYMYDILFLLEGFRNNMNRDMDRYIHDIRSGKDASINHENFMLGFADVGFSLYPTC